MEVRDEEEVRFRLKDGTYFVANLVNRTLEVTLLGCKVDTIQVSRDTVWIYERAKDHVSI